MINSLEINNFQSWKKVKLLLHTGVNVIVGPSNKGKSSIFRALNWVVNNRPTGNSFRSNFTKDKTSSILELDGRVIKREKNNKINSYNIDNSPEDLQALRSDVPDEIKNITKMGKINFQPQNENFFLLDETSGKVAKRFNEIAGLEIMDKSLASANSILRESKQDLKTTDKNIERLNEEIKDLDWIESCNERYSKIEEQESLLQSHKENLDIIEDLVIKYDNILSESHKLPSPEALPKIKSILDLDDTIYEIESEVKNMNSLLSDYATLEEKINRISALDKAKLSTTSEHKTEMDDINKQVDKIDDLFSSFEKNSTAVDQAKSLMNLAKEDLFNFKQEHPSCPTCGEPWK